MSKTQQIIFVITVSFFFTACEEVNSIDSNILYDIDGHTNIYKMDTSSLQFEWTAEWIITIANLQVLPNHFEIHLKLDDLELGSDVEFNCDTLYLENRAKTVKLYYDLEELSKGKVDIWYDVKLENEYYDMKLLEYFMENPSDYVGNIVLMCKMNYLNSLPETLTSTTFRGVVVTEGISDLWYSEDPNVDIKPSIDNRFGDSPRSAIARPELAEEDSKPAIVILQKR